MATPTPGILLKLLQAMNSGVASRPAGDHRSPLLQVTAILPALAAPNDLYSNQGHYLLQISDSLHSTYVSLPPSLSDSLILSNRLQLGQFVHIDRLILDPSCSPLPFPSSLRPVPGVHPLLGSPSSLLVRCNPSGSYPSSARDFVIQPVSDDPDSADPLSAYLLNKKPNSGVAFGMASNENEGFSRSKKEEGGARVSRPRAALTPRENMSNFVNSADVNDIECKEGQPDIKCKLTKFSSPAIAKKRSASVGKKPPPERDPSPMAVKGKRSASPVPSKCVVPSLAAAKEEGERKGAVREAAIVVPSRYRQPSPNARKQGIIAAVNPRRCSISPGRRLSGGVKVAVSPLVGDSCGKKKIVGISKASEMGKAGRKSWGNDDLDQKCKVDPQAILRTQAAISRRLSDAGNPNGEDSPSNAKTKHAAIEAIKAPPAIVIHEKKWTDGSIPLDYVSKELGRLGQDAMQRRTIASIAAAEALEEATITEAILRSLSKFSDLCSVSKAENPMPAIDQFFKIYDEVLKSARTTESMDRNSSPVVDNIPSGKSNFSVWVETALATDLQIVNFLTDQDIDPTSTPRNGGVLNRKRTNDALQPNVELKTAQDWTKGQGVKENVELCQKLQTEMQSWFLRFVEESLDAGFRVFGDGSGGGSSGRGRNLDCSSVAAVLSNLKRVNDWLDRVGPKPEGKVTEKIDRLKRKIYGFVIKHVGSTYDNCNPASSAAAANSSQV
ncbi:hypothetical protein MLD38_014377 [Melastoma candidum]|uniref:Uncharacterized protein n=1 Tax=Melastoma candidum TaxID=119954 RepID=A0ACB9RBX9_9MYRT|nr:hypothetical protein MLD38_014377 [Melastoma candidum]